MRRHHVAGEKAFVDYSGKRIGIADPTKGEIREAEIFVGVLGASNLTYAEATWTQQLPDWTGAQVRMFRFFGGAPKLLVPDNLKSGGQQGLVLRPRDQPHFSRSASAPSGVRIHALFRTECQSFLDGASARTWCSWPESRMGNAMRRCRRG